MKKLDKDLAIHAEYEKRVKEYEFQNLGNGLMADDDLAKYQIMQDVLKEMKTKESNVSRQKINRAKNITRELKDKQKEYKEQMKALKKPSSDYEVFSYTALDNGMQYFSILDKFISLLLNRMNEKGKLDIMRNKSETVLFEERSTLFSDCYSFINYVCNSIKEPNDIIRFNVDSRFAPHLEEVLSSHKFRRYDFKYLHHTVAREPSILEVHLKEGWSN